jgi:putative tryptophan/tyrosine transport system substrate-binding protein
MDRRAVLALGVAGVMAGPTAARAQGRPRLPRLGLIAGPSPSNTQVVLDGLRELGHVGGQTVELEVLSGGVSRPRYVEIAAKFVAGKVDVIAATNPYGVEAAIKATRTIPIVGLDLESDPVASGWIASLARPGGNVTGIFLDIPEMSGKQLQFLSEAVPKLERVAVLGEARVNELQFKATEAAARMTGLKVHALGVTSVDDIVSAVAEAVRQQAGGLVALTSPLMFNGLPRLAESTLKHRIAAICPFVPAFADSGGLLAYGPFFPALLRRLAGYVDQVLKGARPADLPVQRPDKFELVINLKTARALKLTLPWSLVSRADRVIGQ